MSSAKRRINSTGRKRIGRENIDIRMLECPAGEPLKAKASLDIGSLGFPETASVTIEAYHRSSGMRFDCGTVGAPTIPPVLVLNEVDRGGTVLFRVKIVDNDNEVGKLLGAAERIQPRSDNHEDGRKSLFPVQFIDLGPLIWRVSINYEERPVLFINNRIPGITQRLHEDPLFQGLLLPAALRIVLEKIAQYSDGGDEDDDGVGWKDEWLQFCKAELGADDPEGLDDEGRKDWVDDAVQRFCESKNFIKRIVAVEASPNG